MKSLQIVLLYKRNAGLDQSLLSVIEPHLIQQGHSVFVDRHLELGVSWAKEIEEKVRQADAIIPLLSNESTTSEMLAFEIENAHEAAQSSNGRPKIFPVRVQFADPYPEPLQSLLSGSEAFEWNSEKDNSALLQHLDHHLKTLPSPEEPAPLVIKKGLRLLRPESKAPRPPVVKPSEPDLPRPLPLEPIGGAVPLTSSFYLDRPADEDMKKAITRYDSIILVKGARQMGKTSLLARGLQFARERGAKVAMTDFQKLDASHLASTSSLYLSLAESLAEQLDLSVLPADVWDERRGPNVNFERFLRREVLSKLNAPLVWGMDEVDRLFLCSFGSEVFGLFRAWHNERALDPNGPWAGLTLAICYATEAHLFITDMNQSPFNVGTRLALEDFSAPQISDLNIRYHSPLKTEAEIQQFHDLLGGHPFLVRRGLHELSSQQIPLSAFLEDADRDEGLFGDHLRRILVLLAKDPALTDVLRGVLKGKPCPSPESFYRLRSAGVIMGHSQSDAKPRCELYAKFLKRHLL